MGEVDERNDRCRQAENEVDGVAIACLENLPEELPFPPRQQCRKDKLRDIGGEYHGKT